MTFQACFLDFEGFEFYIMLNEGRAQIREAIALSEAPAYPRLICHYTFKTGSLEAACATAKAWFNANRDKMS